MLGGVPVPDIPGAAVPVPVPVPDLGAGADDILGTGAVLVVVVS